MSKITIQTQIGYVNNNFSERDYITINGRRRPTSIIGKIDRRVGTPVGYNFVSLLK